MKLEAVKKYNCTADFWSFTAETFVTPTGERPLSEWTSYTANVFSSNILRAISAGINDLATPRKFYHSWGNSIGSAVSVSYEFPTTNFFNNIKSNTIYYIGNFDAGSSSFGNQNSSVSFYNTRDDAIKDTNRINLARTGTGTTAKVTVSKWNTELQIARDHYFSKKIQISLGTDRTDRITIFAKEPLPLFSELRNIKDAGGNIVLKDGIWRIKSASPVLNAFNKTEGYRMTAELYSGLGYEWSQTGRQIYGSDVSQYIDARE
jgi:hypothetical protein